MGTTAVQRQINIWYEEAMGALHTIISAYFKRVWPNEFAKYQTAFQAGRWFDIKDCVFLGHAIVYKMQVRQHRDGLDRDICAILATGSYEGAHAIFPDIRVKHL